MPGFAIAGGLGGDAFNAIVPGSGTALDHLHDQIKTALPPYKRVEEGASGGVRHITQEVAAQMGDYPLQVWIVESRNDAIRAGVSPIPQHVRNRLEGFVPVKYLDAVRYRVGQGNFTSLSNASFNLEDQAAITLIDVIVFRNGAEADGSVSLWAHELVHVSQYLEWGLRNFAISYIRNAKDVEREAIDKTEAYIAWRNQQDQYAAQTDKDELARGLSNRCRLDRRRRSVWRAKS